MKIGILVDGQAEYHGLPFFLEKVKTEATILRPLYCNMHPHAPLPQIAHVAAKKAAILENRDITDLVLLIDKETRTECTPHIAVGIQNALQKRVATPVSVVVKVTMFENWLVADPDALAQLKPFKETGHIVKAVAPNKADHVDALALLNRALRRGRFDKVNGAKMICAKLDPERAAQNSRSLRRFLRVLGHAAYRDQSKRPRR